MQQGEQAGMQMGKQARGMGKEGLGWWQQLEL